MGCLHCAVNFITYNDCGWCWNRVEGDIMCRCLDCGCYCECGDKYCDYHILVHIAHDNEIENETERLSPR